MVKISHGNIRQYDRRRPHARKDKTEFPKGKKVFTLCSICRNVYYKKSWHHDFPANVLPEKHDVRFELCPACKMIQNKQFEGQVIIENIPEEKRKELINVIQKSGEQGMQADPQDRIIKVQSVKRKTPKESTPVAEQSTLRGKEHPTGQAQNIVEVLTTENQLARRVARRIKEHFNIQISQKITFSKGEDIIRIRMRF